MKIASIVARYLLGLLFTVIGLNGFLHFIPSPAFAPSSYLVEFSMAMLRSGFSIMVFGVQVICGILLLIDQYVPLALVALAAVLVNIFTFHITMQPAGLIPMPIIALILWFLTAWPMRAQFTCILVRKVSV
jgi:putative oxidoreductase